MADIQIRRINDKFDIAYDPRQWILRRWGGVSKKTGEDVWAASKFVTTRARLFYVGVQAGISKNEMWTAIEDLPETHAEFMSVRNETDHG